MAREITYNDFKISLVVFMSNISTNHAITYTYLFFMYLFMLNRTYHFIIVNRLK